MSIDEASFNQTFRHGKVKANGVHIHYVTGGEGEPVVLLHGFPQTWFAWRQIMPALAERYTVIVADLRGLGDSEKTISGYDKRTLAEDIYQLVKILGYERFFLVGHDFGGSTAYALAAAHPQAVRKLVAIECVPAGLLSSEETRLAAQNNLGNRAWFPAFHQVPDLPEALVAGREMLYLSWFFEHFTENPQAITRQDIDEYVRAYSKPGGMRVAFELYRTASIDAIHNSESLKTKLTMPVLALGASGCWKDTTLQAMLVGATDVRGSVIENCGHFVPEEQPKELLRQLLSFFDKD